MGQPQINRNERQNYAFNVPKFEPKPLTQQKQSEIVIPLRPKDEESSSDLPVSISKNADFVIKELSAKKMEMDLIKQTLDKINQKLDEY